MVRAYRRADDFSRDRSKSVLYVVVLALVFSGLCAIFSIGVVLAPHAIPLPEAGYKVQQAASSRVGDSLHAASLHEGAAQSSLNGRAARPASARELVNGEIWVDSENSDLQGHGGFVLQHEGEYWWYGEVKAGLTKNAGGLARVDSGGVAVYSSPDLRSWRARGLALDVSTDPAASGDLRASRVLERPRVLYNAARRAFVMWLHVDSASYEDARVGVAVAQAPAGPFQYRGSFRPNRQQSRDFTLFRDDDGAAYLLYASNSNADLHLTRMTNDYLSLEKPFVALAAFRGRYREAPILWKHEGLYYLWTSGATGWEPNRAELHIAASLEGPWLLWGSPACGSAYQGEGSGSLQAATNAFCNTTFAAQGSSVLAPWPAASDDSSMGFLWMADRWRAADLASSGFVWLRGKLVPPEAGPGAALRDRVRQLRVHLPWSSHFWDEPS